MKPGLRTIVDVAFFTLQIHNFGLYLFINTSGRS